MNNVSLVQLAKNDGMQLALTPNGKIEYAGENEVVKRWLPKLKAHKPEVVAALKAEQIVQSAIVDLPTSFAEVTSSLFVPWPDHAAMFANGDFTPEIIRQTVGSWLLYGKKDIYPFEPDAAEQILRKEQYR